METLNLRVLIYLHPSCVDRVTHKINMESDSGWCLVKDTVEAMNKICEYHFLFSSRPKGQAKG